MCDQETKTDGKWFCNNMNIEGHGFKSIRKTWQVFYPKFMQHLYPAKFSRFQGLPAYCK